MWRWPAVQRLLRQGPAAQRPQQERAPNAHAKRRRPHFEDFERRAVDSTWKPPPPVLPVETRYSQPSAAYSCASRPEAFVVHTAVKAGNVFTVTIEEECRSAFAGADNLLACLTPARVWHLRINVRPEAVFGGLQRLPHPFRTLIGEAETHDRLD